MSTPAGGGDRSVVGSPGWVQWVFDTEACQGIFRNAGMVTETANRFADAGYRVEVVVVATPAPVSRLSAELRSLDEGYPMVGRWQRRPEAARVLHTEQTPRP